MKYPQPPTPIKTKKMTASEIENTTVISRKTRYIDRKYYWIRNRITQQ